uniref:Uncharacterized protein n=1 Tax=Oryza sativa subsp. japonica TaxID=39947 RepID=Q10RH4_ORYSJ|nr:hypothetical protein LOC_Os03g06320 [Oryza sativa Japonica Group]
MGSIWVGSAFMFSGCLHSCQLMMFHPIEIWEAGRYETSDAKSFSGIWVATGKDGLMMATVHSTQFMKNEYTFFAGGFLWPVAALQGFLGPDNYGSPSGPRFFDVTKLYTKPYRLVLIGVIDFIASKKNSGEGYSHE